MKTLVRVPTDPTPAGVVVPPKSLIHKDCSYVPTVPTYINVYVRERGNNNPSHDQGIRKDALGRLRKGGNSGNSGNSKILQVRARRTTTGVNDRGHVVGEDHHRAKLSDHDCWLICELKCEGLSYRQIAAKFEVSRETIADIVKGRRRAQTATGHRVCLPR